MRQKIGVLTAALVVILLTISLDAFATPPPEHNRNCPPDPDTGWIVCGSQCFYPNACKAIRNPAVGIYCRQAKLVNGYPANVCFSGDYDPCCDPNHQW